MQLQSKVNGAGGWGEIFSATQQLANVTGVKAVIVSKRTCTDAHFSARDGEIHEPALHLLLTAYMPTNNNKTYALATNPDKGQAHSIHAHMHG